MIQGKRVWELGSHIPAVWIRPGVTDVMLQIGYGTGPLGDPTSMGDQAIVYKPTTKFNTGNWVNLKISQTNAMKNEHRDDIESTSGLYEIKIDDEVVFIGTNEMAQTWKNVKVVMGNNYGWPELYSSAIGEYRNFEIISRGFDGSYAITKQNLAENKILCPKWSLSFDLYIEGKDVKEMRPLIGFSRFSGLPSVQILHDHDNTMLVFDYQQSHLKGVRN